MVLAQTSHLKVSVLIVLVLTLAGIPWMNRQGSKNSERAQQDGAVARGKKAKDKRQVEDLLKSARKALDEHDVAAATGFLNEAIEPASVPSPEPVVEPPAKVRGGDEGGEEDEKEDALPEVERTEAATASPTEPAAIVEALHELGLDIGEPWHLVNDDGLYRAALKKKFGDNEVSCVLESYVEGIVQRTTLEAEFRSYWQGESEMIALFTRAATTVCSAASPELLEAIEEQDSWSHASWKLERIPRSSGHDLQLQSDNLGARAPSDAGH